MPPKKYVSHKKYIPPIEVEFPSWYKPPTDTVFEEIKKEAINIWKNYDNTYGYRTEKIGRIKNLENVKDNTLYIISMFDMNNQRKLYNAVSEESKDYVRKSSFMYLIGYTTDATSTKSISCESLKESLS